MKAGWKLKEIGDLCEVIAGQSPEGKYYNTEGNGIPFYQGKKDFGEKFIEAPTTWTTDTTKIARQGDILMSVRAPVGPINFATSKICIGRGLAAIRSGPELNHDFLFYQLWSLQPQIAGNAGAVFASINKSDIEKIGLTVAPVPEQKRIVGILDEAFNSIATAKANAEKNLQNARALFESHLQSIFTHRSKGWVQKTLENVCHQITDGKHGDCEEQDGSGFYFLSAKDIKGGTPNWEEARQITKRDFEETNRRTNLEPGDILITNSGTIGRMAIAPKDDRTTKTTFQKSVAILKPRKSEIDSKFAFYCLSSGLTRFVNLSAGAAQKNLLLRDLRNYQFSLPKSLDQQVEVARKLNNLSDETQRLESTYKQKLAALEALKKSLLHQAFSGQL
ncbi:MAG TPA: restriction endonuclease subunit S [Candidatus Binatus sp.]|jgi:type I restriction enzyme S subunit|nr:restriction endonuclease subunit S [Candidatus Binatus sp.]